MVGVEMLVVIVVVMFGVVLAFVICVIIDVDMVAVVIVIVEGDEMVIAIVVEVVVGVVFGMHFLFFSSHIQQACHHGYSFFLKSRFHINASTIISI